MDKDMKIGNCQLMFGDCLERMKEIPDRSIDMILCDLPYGTTQCKWDVRISFDQLWSQYLRIIKENGVITLFGSEPFSSMLRLSNIKLYKYDWIWKKTKATGFFDCKKRPLNDNETISIFYRRQPPYNPQMSISPKIYKRGYVKRHKSDCYGEEKDFFQTDNGLRYPKRIIEFGNADTRNVLHQTQKPLPLLEYLIKTYTDKDMLILDNCMGSGSTGVACVNTNRKFIGIELDEKYYDISCKRIKDAIRDKKQQLF